MPDTKITALTALTTADPANDMMPIVDVSDTSMAASGTTKRISINNILACSPSATLASATISGDLTVDTSTLKVDSTNNRVGIGTASPGTALQIASVSPTIRIQDTSTSVVGGVYGTIDWLSSDSSMTGLAAKIDTFDDGATYGDRAAMRFFTNNGAANTEKYRIASDGVFSWYDGAGGTRMTLNSTGLGVGGSPIASHFISVYGPICVTGTAGGTRTSYISNANTGSIYYTDGGGSGYFTDFGNLIIQPRTSAARSVVIATGSTTPVERAVVKSTGQVRFVPLASDPAGAEAGDVYYNSTSNKLKCYNGTTWNDLF